MTTLERLARDYAAAHRQYAPGKTWDQWCGALMYRMCDTYGHAPTGDVSSAWTVWKRTPTAGTNPADAPEGAFHFFDIGGSSNGDVKLDVRGGGGMCFAANRSVTESLGDAIGFQSVAEYLAARPAARYVGWTLTYANGDVTNFTPGAGPVFAGGGGTGLVNYHWWELTSEAMKACQAMLKRLDLYSGDVDGDFGQFSVKGMQQFFINIKLLPADYVVDGIPYDDPNTASKYGYAWQDWVAPYGYTAAGGKRDGLPGSLTSQYAVIAANATQPTTPTPPPTPAPVPGIPVLPAGQVFGVDIATSQQGFDFAAYQAGGGDFVLVKMGGGNASDSPYTAPRYVEQLAGARAAGLTIGHYWFNGHVVPVDVQADYFAAHIDLKAGELIALDIEAETATSTTAFTPAEALQFIKRFQTHKPGAKFLLYMSASLVRSGAWKPLVGAGHGLWVAMYDQNDGTVPATPPQIDDWASWSIWQYASQTVRVPGYGGNVDVNIGIEADLAKFGYIEPTPAPPMPGVEEAIALLEHSVADTQKAIALLRAV